MIAGRAQAALTPVGIAFAPTLAALHARCFNEAWSAQAFVDFMILPGTAALIAEEAGAPLGFVLYRVVAGEGEILTIGAAPEARRRGVGGRILAAALLAAGRAGAEAMFLEVAESNDAALGLYRAFGFRQVGRRPGYYQRAQGPAEAALVMRRDLSA